MTAPTARERALRTRQRAAAQAIAVESTYHQARVLLLINAFSGRTRGIRGLAKLVRLDFLLRFPHLLPHLPMSPRLEWPVAAALDAVEQAIAEDDFSAARYGLWYDRYTLLLAALSAKLLITVGSGRVLEPIVTADGRRASRQLAEMPSWDLVAARAQFLKNHLNLSGDRLDRLFSDALASRAAGVAAGG